ncbi:coiled-coil domain-containing protein 97 [Scaptodrosophila lebanonensis]|uniref:Coiled-coil domain-containing protein 97 n=1 Tax=Drosophila lebanonensis TaxID=7225 RepID=A0A6J2U8L0_DROLE|nr:coiled-coil domain-containing protein 97 [Scaptodrosophila lebanonensis]
MTTGSSNSEASDNTELPDELVCIFKSLASNDKIIFKSQQIDDPELMPAQKQEIAHNAFKRNRKNFLIRFGQYLNESQIDDFLAVGLQSSEAFQPTEDFDDMCLLLEDFRRKLQTRSICVKNRRYVAMRQLLDQGEYFSEHEMMQRAPELYDELVGQYMTEEEKKERDSYDVRSTTFSGILMHTLEQKQRDELLEQVREETAPQTSEPATTNPEFEVPAECRKQWGGFDNDEPVACSTSRATTMNSINNSAKPACYYPGERELLRHEFMSIMKERFISGDDKDFDYTAVDENALLDDLKQIEQDEEDAYFEASDNEEATESAKPVHSSEDSEDELEVYMRHLHNHHSLQH